MPLNRSHSSHRKQRGLPRSHKVALGAAAVSVALSIHALLALAAPKHQIAVVRPSTGEWVVRAEDGRETRILFGKADDVPVARDYLGLGRAQIARFRPSTREWFIRRDDGTEVSTTFGEKDDVPVPGDYLELGRAQLAVFRPSNREWHIRKDDGGEVVVQFGDADDVPVPGDYLGLNRVQMAVFRPKTQVWLIRKDDDSADPIQFGGEGDLPVPGDYLGLKHTQIAVFRPSTGKWFIRKDDGDAAVNTTPFGEAGDIPVAGDYDGSERTKIAVFRPKTQEWILRNDDETTVKIRFGAADDVPAPAPYGIGPAAPSNLAAAADSQTQITLTWKDNSPDETGFKIERRTGAGSFAEIASTAANITTFANTGLTTATSYSYRVRAAGAGNLSGYSNEVTATTQSAVAALSLDKDVQPIFTANCALSGCHAGSRPSENMDLSAGKSFSQIVNVDARARGKKRVVPGNPAASFLYEKISVDRPSVGSRMPDGRPRLPQSEIDKVRQWIEQGAKP